MSSSYPRDEQVDVRQDQDLVEAEQPVAVQENILPPPYSQETTLYGLPQPPVPTIPTDQPQGGSMTAAQGMAKEDERFADRLGHSRKCRVIWGTVGVMVIAVKVIAAIVLLVILPLEH